MTLLIYLISLASASAQYYSGSLSSEGGGIVGTGFWVNDDGRPDWHGATVTWEVERNHDGSWHYKYILDVYRSDVTHLILETSDDFTSEDLYNLSTGNPTFGIFSPGGGATPTMPDDIYGFRLDGVTGTYLAIEFDTPRSPVWGDFYARGSRAGGTWHTAWNAGFTYPDTDPDVWRFAPSSGSVANHILVPDSVSGHVPEPATLSLMGVGLAALAIIRRRKS